MNTFDRYAPFIRDYVFQNGWGSLRAVQVAAAEAIFDTDDNVLLSASTASGKTEAAFFPILTLMSEEMPASVGALYIAPLKALINDQFERLNDLCREAEIPIWHWHGDVSQTRKQKLMKNPSGILQITPESLEAMMMRKRADIARLFGDLRFVVIDEVHSLLRADRGGQTLCLVERLSRLAGVNPRRIGLSATIGDPEAAGRFLSEGTGRRTVVPQIQSPGNRWRLCMEHFYVGSDERIEAADEAPESADPGLGFIFEHTRDRKCLVFVNSREECEAVTNTLRRYCEERREPDRFMIHHGNLSTSYRETAEEVMKDDEQMQTTVTTATLELGIDIGRLERAFQINAPFTVSSFLQRMGRTGRREQPQEMWFVIREEKTEPRALLPVTVPWKMLQAIALVQLYVEERWVEPPRLNRLAYSLLYHQTMSELSSGGEMLPAALASKVLTLTYFRNVSAEDYKMLLRHLIAIGHIQKTERGGLIVGLEGERITNSFKFYAVFKENEEYTCRSDSQELGTIVQPPPVGEKIVLAGKVWIVDEIDRKRRLLYCHGTKGNASVYFGEVAGDINTKILERMHRVLYEEESYPYLLRSAGTRLQEARRTAFNAGLKDNMLINLGGSLWALFPWAGTYTFLAMERFLKIKCGGELGISSFESARPYFMQFSMAVSKEKFAETVRRKLEEPLDPMELVYKSEVPLFDKYDEFLPDELVRKGFAYGVLDTEEMKKKFLEIADSIDRENLTGQ